MFVETGYFLFPPHLKPLLAFIEFCGGEIHGRHVKYLNEIDIACLDVYALNID